VADVFEEVTRIGVLRAAHARLRRLTVTAHARVGGKARLRVILLFAGVEGLSSADQGTVGSVAPQLEHAMHISNGELGLVAAVGALAGAFGTVPAGMLTDRVNRIGLLAGSIVMWSAAMVASALAPSFVVLLLTRLALGAVTATSGPTVASLIGDFFPAGERAKMWGLILTGELVGAGIGLVASGNLAGALSWRYGFGWLAMPGMLLALGIWKLLVEPARGGQSRLQPGATELLSAGDAARLAEADGRRGAPHAGQMIDPEQELAHAAARKRDEDPHAELVLHEDPVDMPLWTAIRYVLSVRTNAVLIFASALAYLFFAGVQTFALLLLRSRYGLSQSVASSLLIVVGLGAVAGVVVAGRLADRLLRGGMLNARVVVGAVSYLAAAAIFVPALASPALIASMPLFVLGAAAVAAPDATLNAARLDVMHPRLWGRAEGVRTVLRLLALAVGPILFGFISGALGGPHNSIGAGGAVRHSDALAYTFLIMLPAVALSGLVLLRARRSYPRDVATAAASVAATARVPSPRTRSRSSCSTTSARARTS
jgi:MFS family permease